MKRKHIIAAMAALCCLTGCSNQTPSSGAETTAVTKNTTFAQSPTVQETSADNISDSPEKGGSNILVAYFSYPEPDGIDAVAGASRIVTEDGIKGNVQFMSEIIADNTGGDLFRIETVQVYPESHDKLVDFAADELSEGARPELSSHIENIDDYDTVFIGYPNWWADMPMPLYTFFEEYDFSGKTIIPFTSHGGSGFSGTINSMAEIEPDANVITDGFCVSRNNTPDSAGDIAEWLNSLGY